MSFSTWMLGGLFYFFVSSIVFPFIGWLLVRFSPFKKAGLRLIALDCFSGKQVSRVCHKYKVFRCSSCGRDDCRNWTCADYKNPLK